jgi:RNA polymerase sigma-54 factor
MAHLELRDELQQALLENPFLELVEGGGDSVAEASGSADVSGSDSDAASDERGEAVETEYVEAQAIDEIDAAFDGDMSGLSTATSHSADSDREDNDPLLRRAEVIDPRQQLMEDARFLGLSAADYQLAVQLIDSLDDNGWITTPLAQLASELNVPLAQLERVLVRLKSLEPIGLFACDLLDCLRLQLLAKPASAEVHAALRLIERGLLSTGRADAKHMLRAVADLVAEIEPVLQLIKGLAPRPLSLLDQAPNDLDYVVPDAYILKRGKHYVAQINKDSLPELKINNYYQQLLRSMSANDAQNLRGRLQEARWYLKNVQARNATLLRVTQAIADAQREFLLHGAIAMRPMAQRELADQLGLHESTISRVANGKYLMTPQGLFEIRYFFSTMMGKSDGSETSAIAIKALIKKLISEEPKTKPCSDQDIADSLQEQGYEVARRTVAKYREALGYATASQRRQLS